MNHPSPRLVLAAMSLAVLGGTATAAAADTEQQAQQRVICIINQDASFSAQNGVCVILPSPTLP